MEAAATEGQEKRLDHIKGQAGEKIEELKGKAHDKVEELKGKAQEGYAKASEKVHETWEKVEGSSLKDVEDAVSGYVKEKPGRCIAIAAVAGLVVGALLRGRRH